MKTTLVTLLIPVMEYPLIPICVASKTQKRNMQIILKKTLRFIHCNEAEQLNTLELHIKYNTTHPNISIYRKPIIIREIIKK